MTQRAAIWAAATLISSVLALAMVFGAGRASAKHQGNTIDDVVHELVELRRDVAKTNAELSRITIQLKAVARSNQEIARKTK